MCLFIFILSYICRCIIDLLNSRHSLIVCGVNLIFFLHEQIWKVKWPFAGAGRKLTGEKTTNTTKFSLIYRQQVL